METFAEGLAKCLRFVSHRSLITLRRDILETSFARPGRLTDAKSLCKIVLNHRARLCSHFSIGGKLIDIPIAARSESGILLQSCRVDAFTQFEGSAGASPPEPGLASSSTFIPVQK